MKPIGFCKHCGLMEMGFNKAYVLHRLGCRNGFTKSSALLILWLVLAGLILVQSDSDALASGDSSTGSFAQPMMQASLIPMAGNEPVADPALKMTDALLKEYGIPDSRRTRVVQAIVSSSRKHKLDPRLVASIVIVESHANPFAISPSDAVGVMQIHVPTWAAIVEKEDIDLFNVEDNIDFGVRILKGYVERHGVAEGIKRYNGWHSARPETILTAEAYLQKVQSIYGPASGPAAATE